MTFYIIGSTAAKHWFPDWRDPKDLDVFAEDWADPAPGVLDPMPAMRVEKFWDDRLLTIIGGEQRTEYATPDELYTIKHSHVYWELRNGTWGKHMADLLTLQDRGAQLIPDMHDDLYKIWEDAHGKKQVNLTEESDEFFEDAVTRRYDHDSLHRSVAYDPGKPIYEDCLKDGKSVQMDMKKVWALPFEDQLALFREEIYVTALERLIIPNDYKYSAGAAYQWALRRTITSLTKGKSARFLVSNFRELIKPDINYVAQHLAGARYLEEL